MVSLQSALTLLQGNLGELDNVKFMLGSTDGKGPDAVESEALRLARGIASGEYKSQHSLRESALKASKIAI